MCDWQLLLVNYDTGIELWKTPTKYLVCRKYYGLYKFLDTEKQAHDCFERKIHGESFQGAQLNKMLSLGFLFGYVIALAISGFLLEAFINLFKQKGTLF